MTTRYGIVGAGMIAREHIQNILLLENALIEAIIEPNLEQQKISCSIAGNPRLYQSIEDALEDSSIDDAWVLAFPNFTHKDALAMLMKSSKPILVEKPICTTFEQCEEIENMVKSYSAPV